MIVERVVKRIETALINHDVKSLASATQDIGNEIVRKRISILNNFLAKLSEVTFKLNERLSEAEKTYLVTVSNLVNAAVLALQEEEDRAYIRSVFDHYREIIEFLGTRQATVDQIAAALHKDHASIKEALHRMHHSNIVEFSGVRQFWGITTRGYHLLKDAGLLKTGS